MTLRWVTAGVVGAALLGVYLVLDGRVLPWGCGPRCRGVLRS